MLVSVRSVDEALLAAAGGAAFIDLKEPRDGALGALPLAVVRDVLYSLREAGARSHASGSIGAITNATSGATTSGNTTSGNTTSGNTNIGATSRGHTCGITGSTTNATISATIGDGPWTPRQAAERVKALAACGVDYVKVGVMPGDAAGLAALAECPEAVVPVFIVDRGLDPALLERACRGPFPALMLDTADKLAGSLFDCLDLPTLRLFIERTRAAGKLAGLAGALRLHHVDALAGLAPDFAGFRSAVCDGPREGRLEPLRLERLRAALQAAQAVVPAVPPVSINAA